MIGTDAAAKAAPDGYTLLAGSSGPARALRRHHPQGQYQAGLKLPRRRV
jgi:hypothetical protein